MLLLDIVKIRAKKTLDFFSKTCRFARQIEGTDAQTPRIRTKTSRARDQARAGTSEHGTGRIWDFLTVTPLVLAGTVSKTH